MRQMTEGRFRHLPVVDAGRMIGIISIGDVVKHKIEEAEREAEVLRLVAQGRSNREIAAALFVSVPTVKRHLTAILAKGTLQREEAYALVQKNAMAAWEEGRPFLELLKSDPDVTEHLDPSEIEGCFDPARYLRDAHVIFERLEAL